ncbi:hypothetical protein MWR38_19595 [Klebsiella pneumoniae]|uniref:hypothetical protein n=1 Tax=Klebsiella pneumoniae TaxID=573 RepID=UPI002DBA588A|nr:hypothetical protein [Klebsiella pneumoniae]MEB5573547.1 hypothetical protein [Klebsiella pneumoniae]MEB5602593.1 hypothetical protein [Klebsiella pneumoniae]
MDKTRDFILEGLSRFNLADLPGRPYDCAFDLLAATPSRKRLIMMGFNGSLADSCMTNRQAILQDYAHPFISGIQLKWFTEFGHLNRGDMLTSEQHRCHNEKKKFQRRV